ncbi:hypothetical protein LCM23_06515, partial [Cytobacillus kochii]|uniref:hypothetical protein n=1 Tax=Cytobacillus kochii TaxID=859143 RepID=UPI001CD7289A
CIYYFYPNFEWMSSFRHKYTPLLVARFYFFICLPRGEHIRLTLFGFLTSKEAIDACYDRPGGKFS